MPSSRLSFSQMSRIISVGRACVDLGDAVVGVCPASRAVKPSSSRMSADQFADVAFVVNDQNVAHASLPVWLLPLCGHSAASRRCSAEPAAA